MCPQRNAHITKSHITNAHKSEELTQANAHTGKSLESSTKAHTDESPQCKKPHTEISSHKATSLAHLKKHFVLSVSASSFGLLSI